MYMSRIRGPYVRFCERDEAVTPHPTRWSRPTSPKFSIKSGFSKNYSDKSSFSSAL